MDSTTKNSKARAIQEKKPGEVVGGRLTIHSAEAQQYQPLIFTKIKLHIFILSEWAMGGLPARQN